jgi:hypothetical protein
VPPSIAPRLFGTRGGPIFSNVLYVVTFLSKISRALTCGDFFLFIFCQGIGVWGASTEDWLMMELGFLSMFLYPLSQWRSPFPNAREPPRVIMFLVRWFVCGCGCGCGCVCVCVYVCMHVRIYVCNIHTYIRICMHTHTNTHTHTHTYIGARSAR